MISIEVTEAAGSHVLRSRRSSRELFILVNFLLFPSYTTRHVYYARIEADWCSR